MRVPPGTWRGYEAGPEGLEIIVIGAPNLGEAPREHVEVQAMVVYRCEGVYSESRLQAL